MANVNLTGAIAIRAVDSSGDLVSGARLYVYEAGTTTPVTTYADQAGSTANAHPVVGDSAGAFGEVFLPEGEYKIDITTSGGASLPGYPADDVQIGITEITAAEVSLADAGGYWDATNVEAWSQELGAAMPAGALVGDTDTQTLTDKTLTSPVINTGVSGSAILDDATFETASAVTVPTSESVKNYLSNALENIAYAEIATHDFASSGGTFTLVGLSEDDLDIDFEDVSASSLTIETTTNSGVSWGTPQTLGTTMANESGIMQIRGLADATRKTIIALTYGDNSTSAASVVRLVGTAQADDGIRIKTMTGGTLYARRLAGGGAVLNDPLWEFVTLLVQGGFSAGQGTFGNPGFIDLSPAGRTINRGGAAQGDTEVGVITDSSIKFDGDDDYIYVAHDTDLDPGAGPFSWEISLRLLSMPASSAALFACWGPTGSDSAYVINVALDGSINLVYRTTLGGADQTISFAAGLQSGVDYRISIVLNADSNVSCYVNGTQVGTATALVAPIVAYPHNNTFIGRRQDGGGDLHANVNRIRLTRAERTDFSETGLFLAR